MAKWSPKDSYTNPLSLLEPLLLVPLLKENEKVFRPSVEEVKRAQDMFRPERGRCIEPMKGVIHFTDLPDPRLPEVAFIGASNVGKSSLIKALFHDPPDVKISISKKPGHTKVVKLYKLRKAFCLVDMPGYGENMPPYYVESVEEYILKRQQLVRTFLLIDGMTGLTEEDRVGIEMMEEFGRPYALVLTKIDLTTRHIILKNLMEINKERSLWMQGALPQPFLVSAKSGAGVAFLRAFVAYVTGNLKVDSL
ncbi:GTP-binding protein 8 [Lamellibrachia satsuma]|nr:GTP-binding protein 8 [Lamellibrachia satsuma]